MPGDDLGAPIFPDEDWDDVLDLDDEQTSQELQYNTDQMRFQPRILNMLMRLLIIKIPSNQLRSFQ